MASKTALRKALRQARREHVDAQGGTQSGVMRALLFHRPPAPLLSMIAEDAVIGLYHASEYEAPAGSYARFFHEAGHGLALPHLGDEQAAMIFREHSDPFGESDLAAGPFGLMQPQSIAREVEPDVLFVPLVGFTAELDRLGQGGGHYDRWLAAHPDTTAIGLAWDAQLVESLPTEPHDIRLAAIVTPTRVYG